MPADEQAAEAWWQAIEPTLTEEWADEREARQRWLECRDLMRNELATGRFVAEVLTGGGVFEPIPKQEWLGRRAKLICTTG